MTTGHQVISAVTLHVWLSHRDKTNNVVFLQAHWSSGNQWGDCICLIVSQWQNQQCCFYRTTGPLVISGVTVNVWLSHSDKTNKLLKQDHWSSGNMWGDCTCLIVSQWQNQQCCFYRTNCPLVISEVTVHVWLSHNDKSNNVAFTGPLVLWQSVRWLYMFDCLTVTKPTMSFLHDHWSSGNQWSDCTCLIVSQWQNH